jgi:predicted ATPase
MLILWCLGFPDQALARNQEVVALAREFMHPPSLAHALYFTAIVRNWRQEWGMAQLCEEEVFTFATAQELPYWVAHATVGLGWTSVGQARPEEGSAQIRRGIEAFFAMGAMLGRSYFLFMLAEAYSKLGRVQDGLGVLAEALAFAHTTSERFYEAELYRLKGELTLQWESQKLKVKSQKSKMTDPRSLSPGPQGEAEACFLKALDIARQQQSKSLELRATMSLARLWQQQGKAAEAGRVLAEIYEWFTEGFDTADLKEAKALLEELAGQVVDTSQAGSRAVSDKSQASPEPASDKSKKRKAH